MRRSWPYIVAGVVFAGVLGWISYTDALFVTRLAGNDGGIAYAYPTVPDGLLFFSLLALTEAARAGADRPRWATGGLVLGAAMTLAANAGAGLGHSVLDAVIDALVPVCFFIAVEIVLWHVRHGRSALRSSSAVSAPVFTDAQTAALAFYEGTVAAGNPLSQNKLAAQFRLSRAEARDVIERSRGGSPPAVPAAPSPAGAQTFIHRSAPAGDIPSSNGHSHG